MSQSLIDNVIMYPNLIFFTSTDVFFVTTTLYNRSGITAACGPNLACINI